MEAVCKIFVCEAKQRMTDVLSLLQGNLEQESADLRMYVVFLELDLDIV